MNPIYIQVGVKPITKSKHWRSHVVYLLVTLFSPCNMYRLPHSCPFVCPWVKIRYCV